VQAKAQATRKARAKRSPNAEGESRAASAEGYSRPTEGNQFTPDVM